MAAKLATRTGSLSAPQATSLDALGATMQALRLTGGWDLEQGGNPYGTVRLATLQALRSVTTYLMADKVMARFVAKGGRETLSQAFSFAHIGRK